MARTTATIESERGRCSSTRTGVLVGPLQGAAGYYRTSTVARGPQWGHAREEATGYYSHCSNVAEVAADRADINSRWSTASHLLGSKRPVKNDRCRGQLNATQSDATSQRNPLVLRTHATIYLSWLSLSKYRDQHPMRIVPLRDPAGRDGALSPPRLHWISGAAAHRRTHQVASC